MKFKKYQYGEKFKCPICSVTEDRHKHFDGEGKKCLMTYFIPYLDEQIARFGPHSFINLLDPYNQKILLDFFIDGEILCAASYIKLLKAVENKFFTQIRKNEIKNLDLELRDYNKNKRYIRMKSELEY